MGKEISAFSSLTIESVGEILQTAEFMSRCY